MFRGCVQGSKIPDTLNSICAAVATPATAGTGASGAVWTALWLSDRTWMFPVERTIESGGKEEEAFAQNTCIAKVHEQVRTEIVGMAELALKHLLQCKFALAAREARRIVGCKRVKDARDLSKMWINKVYMDCVIAAACICKAKHHTDLRTGAKARSYAKRATDILHVHLDMVCSNETQNMFMAVKYMSKLAREVFDYLEPE